MMCLYSVTDRNPGRSLGALMDQGASRDDGETGRLPFEREAGSFEAVTCTACTRVHLVDPRTGRILGKDED